MTGQLSAEEYQALRLHAVLTGRSVQSVVEAAVRTELTQGLAPEPVRRTGRSREEFVAELLARAGIDPGSPEYLAEVEKARQDVRYTDAEGRPRGAA